MFKKPLAFFLGALEFRLSCTTRVCADNEMAYEWGREIAHRVTLRRFDNA